MARPPKTAWKNVKRTATEQVGLGKNMVKLVTWQVPADQTAASSGSSLTTGSGVSSNSRRRRKRKRKRRTNVARPQVASAEGAKAGS